MAIRIEEYKVYNLLLTTSNFAHRKYRQHLEKSIINAIKIA